MTLHDSGSIETELPSPRVNSHVPVSGHEPSFLVSLMSGGIAGTTVDIALFPLDTIKTRLQSPQGFLKSGGFSGIYKGLGAAALGSAPGAALFFSTYDTLKHVLGRSSIDGKSSNLPTHFVHMTAASLAEVAACVVRVPTEVVKQRLQTGMHKTISEAVSSIVAMQGWRGMYTGFGITIMREIPFSIIQFPLYEALKSYTAAYTGRDTLSYESALFGSLSGGLAAALTTPLDVIKTRLMLGSDLQGVPYSGIADVFKRIVADEGSAKLFSGVGPRVMWISIGGFVFFGAYEKSKSILS